MQLDFRQGIAEYQSAPLYIQLDSGGASLNVSVKPIKVSFAHGLGNYLYIEENSVMDAWMNLNRTDNFWMYWDIDMVTARRSFGVTKIEPTFGTLYPISPVIDQHYFYIPDMKMYFFNGQTWVECIRVFAGSMKAGYLGNEPRGTQVNVNVQNVSSEILFDIYGNPLKKFTDTGFTFLTADDDLPPATTNLNSINMSRLNMSGFSTSYIPRFYCIASAGVDAEGNTQVMAASYMDTTNPAFAITSDDMHPGEVKQLITRGFVQDNTFNFPYLPQTPLFVGGAGEITPFSNKGFSIQKIGHIVNTNTIYINVGRQIIFS
jgi:hypothetical protein